MCSIFAAWCVYEFIERSLTGLVAVRSDKIDLY